jgi:hypothetical protein
MRAKIDAALVDGVTYKRIVARFSSAERPISPPNLCRHRKHLLPKELIRQAPAPDPDVALTLIQRIETLVADSKAIAHAAKGQQQWIAATSALREVRCCIELLGKLTGEISPNINFHSVNFGNLSADQIEAFWDALQKAQNARFRHLLMERLGPPAPSIQVHFVDAPQPEPPLLEAFPANGNNGHA